MSLVSSLVLGQFPQGVKPQLEATVICGVELNEFRN